MEKANSTDKDGAAGWAAVLAAWRRSRARHRLRSLGAAVAPSFH